MDDGRVYIRHIRAARPKLCMSGSRGWFADRGWSWSEFLDDGRPLQDFIDAKCPFADRVVRAAQQEASDGRR